jgi:hypothetical protein
MGKLHHFEIAPVSRLTFLIKSSCLLILFCLFEDGVAALRNDSSRRQSRYIHNSSKPASAPEAIESEVHWGRQEFGQLAQRVLGVEGTDMNLNGLIIQPL